MDRDAGPARARSAADVADVTAIITDVTMIITATTTTIGARARPPVFKLGPVHTVVGHIWRDAPWKSGSCSQSNMGPVPEGPISGTFGFP
jgi:hypothetical protein